MFPLCCQASNLTSSEDCRLPAALSLRHSHLQMLLACSKAGCQALVCAPSRQPRQRSRLQVACKAPSSDSGSSSSVESPSPGLGLKAVWHGAEALGNIIGASKGPSNSMASSTQTLTRQEAVAAVREVSGGAAQCAGWDWLQGGVALVACVSALL